MNELVEKFKEKNKTELEEKIQLKEQEEIEKKKLEIEKEIKRQKKMKENIFENLSIEIFKNNYKIISNKIFEIYVKNTSYSYMYDLHNSTKYIKEFATTKLGLSEDFSVLISHEGDIINNELFYYYKITLYDKNKIGFFEKMFL